MPAQSYGRGSHLKCPFSFLFMPVLSSGFYWKGVILICPLEMTHSAGAIFKIELRMRWRVDSFLTESRAFENVTVVIAMVFAIQKLKQISLRVTGSADSSSLVSTRDTLPLGPVVHHAGEPFDTDDAPEKRETQKAEATSSVLTDLSVTSGSLAYFRGGLPELLCPQQKGRH